MTAARLKQLAVKYRHGLVGATGLLAELVNLGVFHGSAQQWASRILAVAVALGVAAPSKVGRVDASHTAPSA